MRKEFRVNLEIYDMQTAWILNNAISSSVDVSTGQEIDKKLHIVPYRMSYITFFDFTEDPTIHSCFWYPFVSFTTECEACITFERCNDKDYNYVDILKEHINRYIRTLQIVRKDQAERQGKTYFESDFFKCNDDAMTRCYVLLKFFDDKLSEEEKEKYIGFPFDPFKRAVLEEKIHEVEDLTHVSHSIESAWYKILFRLRKDIYEPEEFTDYLKKLK